MVELILTKHIRMQSGLNGKSKVLFWTNIVPGDVLKLSYSMESNYYYHIIVTNLRDNSKFCTLHVSIRKYISQFDWTDEPNH